MQCALRRKPLCISAFRPSGKSILIYGNRVKRKIRRNRKHFALSEVRGVAYDRHPVPTRGALAIVTNAGRGAMDVEAP